jgi:hypothetical protein
MQRLAELAAIIENEDLPTRVRMRAADKECVLRMTIDIREEVGK